MTLDRFSGLIDENEGFRRALRRLAKIASHEKRSELLKVLIEATVELEHGGPHHRTDLEEACALIRRAELQALAAGRGFF